MTESQTNRSRILEGLNDRLADRQPRELAAGDIGPVPVTRSTVRLDANDEIACAAVGALMLRKLAEFGQSRLPEPMVERLVSKLTTQLSSREVMNLEIEAYELLRWMAGPSHDAAHPERVVRREGDTILYDPDSSVLERMQAAIVERFDVKIDYFSRQRGEMNTRRITPERIDAETYVYGYCHARQAYRTFRLNRITRCVPVKGRPIELPRVMKQAQEEHDHDPVQISLLDD
jgi:predicted DNA-binding transcriptional regulator YafY